MGLLPRFRSTLKISLAVSPRPSRRALHLAPPWLLDDYIPRYHLISSVDAAKKRSLAYAHLRECNLCPRLCGVNRYEKTGVCLIGAEKVKVNTIAPHFGEGTANIHDNGMKTKRPQSRVSRVITVPVAFSSLAVTCDVYLLPPSSIWSYCHVV
jgi:hypothetical protein